MFIFKNPYKKQIICLQIRTPHKNIFVAPVGTNLSHRPVLSTAPREVQSKDQTVYTKSRTPHASKDIGRQ
jgi:hypothetical protein